MARPIKTKAVVNANYGLYIGQSPLTVPDRGLIDGLNFRIQHGMISNLNLGWDRFDAFTLDGPVSLISNFKLRDGTSHLIFTTLDNIYKYNSGSNNVTFLTTRYETGTVAVSNANPAVVTGTSTLWNTGTPKNAKAGDKIIFTATGVVDPDLTWYTIDTVDSDTQLTLTTAVAGTPISAGQAYTLRKLFTGRIFEPWDSTVFTNAAPGNADLWFGTNGIDNIVTWNGTDTQVTSLDSLGITAKFVHVYSNMMIYGNVTTTAGVLKPTTIVNSDLGTPEELSSGLASEFVIHDGSDGLVALKTLGDSLILYSTLHITPAQFVGDPLIFNFRDAVVGNGPITGRLIADFGDRHEFMAPASQYSFDGVVQVEVNKHVWRSVLGTRDPFRDNLAFHHFDEENGDLIWALPFVTDTGSGETDTTIEFAYNEHYLEDTPTSVREGKVPTPHSKREFPFTASGFYERQSGLTWDQISDTWEDFNFRWNDNFFSVAFPFNMVGDMSGKIYTLGTAQDADTVALPSFVRFPRKPLGDGRIRGLMKRVYPFATEFPAANYNLNVTLHISDHASGATTATATQGFDLTLPEGEHFVSPFRRARFAEIEFGTPGPAQPWELTGYDTDVVAGGTR